MSDYDKVKMAKEDYAMAETWDDICEVSNRIDREFGKEFADKYIRKVRVNKTISSREKITLAELIELIRERFPGKFVYKGKTLK